MTDQATGDKLHVVWRHLVRAEINAKRALGTEGGGCFISAMYIFLRPECSLTIYLNINKAGGQNVAATVYNLVGHKLVRVCGAWRGRKPRQVRSAPSRPGSAAHGTTRLHHRRGGGATNVAGASCKARDAPLASQKRACGSMIFPPRTHKSSPTMRWSRSSLQFMNRRTRRDSWTSMPCHRL